MSFLAACMRALPRAHRPLHRRAFHSPFVVLSASNPLTTPSPSTGVPIYEKQDEFSPEPHLSSSGTRTYVVSEPDPSDTPYEVPSGAYPASASYVSYKSTTTGSSVPHSHTARAAYEASPGGSAAARSTEAPGEMSMGRGVTNSARTKSGNF